MNQKILKLTEELLENKHGGALKKEFTDYVSACATYIKLKEFEEELKKHKVLEQAAFDKPVLNTRTIQNFVVRKPYNFKRA
jgi:hypothetical protein